MVFKFVAVDDADSGNFSSIFGHLAADSFETDTSRFSVFEQDGGVAVSVRLASRDFSDIGDTGIIAIIVCAACFSLWARFSGIPGSADAGVEDILFAERDAGCAFGLVIRSACSACIIASVCACRGGSDAASTFGEYVVSASWCAGCGFFASGAGGVASVWAGCCARFIVDACREDTVGASRCAYRGWKLAGSCRGIADHVQTLIEDFPGAILAEHQRIVFAFGLIARAEVVGHASEGFVVAEWFCGAVAHL